MLTHSHEYYDYASPTLCNYFGGALPVSSTPGIERGEVGRGFDIARENIPLKGGVTESRYQYLAFSQSRTTDRPTGNAIVLWQTVSSVSSCCSINSWSLGRERNGGRE